MLDSLALTIPAYMLIVICLNVLIALCVFKAAMSLWRWRCQLAHVAQLLASENLSGLSQQARYKLTYRRVQLAQMQLTWVSQQALWQQRSRQIKQARQLIGLLQLVLLSRRDR